MALEPYLSSAINVYSTKDPPPYIDMTIPAPDLLSLEAQRKRGLLQLDDCNTFREEMNLVTKVIEGITSWRDKSIIEETVGENIHLDGI